MHAISGFWHRNEAHGSLSALAALTATKNVTTALNISISEGCVGAGAFDWCSLANKY
jgi:hypothetical protein